MFPNDFDEYMKYITSVCISCISSSNGMSASFIYQSAKDSLKWHNMSIKDNIQTVMRIGVLLNLSNEDFENMKNDNEFLDVNLDELNAFYEDM